MMENFTASVEEVYDALTSKEVSVLSLTIAHLCCCYVFRFLLFPLFVFMMWL